MKEWILGRNPVYECLRASRRHSFRLLVASGVEEKGRLVEILDFAREKKLIIQKVLRGQLDNLGDNHQGVASGNLCLSLCRDRRYLRRGRIPG